MAKYHNGLATSYYRRRDYAAAVDELTRAVRLDSLYAPARFNLGNALLRTGRREEGQRQWTSIGVSKNKSGVSPR